MPHPQQVGAGDTAAASTGLTDDQHNVFFIELGSAAMAEKLPLDKVKCALTTAGLKPGQKADNHLNDMIWWVLHNPK